MFWSKKYLFINKCNIDLEVLIMNKKKQVVINWLVPQFSSQLVSPTTKVLLLNFIYVM